MKKIVQLTLMMAVVIQLQAQVNSKHQVITSNGYKSLNTYLVALANESLNSSQHQFYLRINNSPTQRIVYEKGVLLGPMVQPNIYIAYLKKQVTEADLQALGIEAWLQRQPNDKLNPLLKETFSQHNNADLLIETFPHITKAEMELVLKAQGLQLQPEQPWEGKKVWLVDVAANQLNALASLNEIISITPNMEAKPLMSRALGLTNTSMVHLPVSLGGYQLDGSGIIIGVGDDSDPNHVDYIDRIISFNPQWRSDHGFFTTGIAASNGIKDQRYTGFANRTTVVSDYFSQIIANSSTYVQDFDMVATNNSYGNILGNCSYSGTYDIYSRILDEIAMQETKLLNVFAAANDGGKNCSPYPLGYATITGSYSTAKNVLTVGALSSRPQLVDESSFSSKGPVKDGRMKPEITAMGAQIYSNIENNNYNWGSGTSSSSPNVTGAAALLIQRYRQLFAGQNPKSGLVKNLLMNGATDIGRPGPDFMHGFGMLNTVRSLKILDSNRYFTNTINTNIEHTFNIAIPPNVSAAKIMLYWHDPEAAALSSKNLINDLDLTVVAPNSTIALPLVLNTVPGMVMNNAQPGVDTVNNAEQVVLQNPTPGNCTIKVKGSNIPVANQEYFVSYDYIYHGLSIQYPVGNEAVAAGEEMIVYWEASENTNTFTVSFSTDNGANWQIVDNSIAADLRNFTFQLPAGTLSNQCLVRVSRNNTNHVSQSKVFTIAERPVLQLADNNEQCPGSIKMKWNAVAGVSTYRIFRKVGIDIQAIATTADTFYTISGLHTDSVYWTAVAPIVNGTDGMRSVAESRIPNNGFCAGWQQHGDLNMSRIVAPLSGRLFTSTSLGTTQPLTVIVGNFDNLVASNYQIAYSVNNSTWMANQYSFPINPSGYRQLTIGQLDLSAAGNYQIKVAVTNLSLADPHNQNDTLTFWVKQIENNPLNLNTDFEETFENAAINNTIIGRNEMGIPNMEHWDFGSTGAKGRFRNFVNSAISISGSKSASLDNAMNQRYDIAGSGYNTLTGTFNLVNYDTATAEIRVSFDYLLHGYPKFDTGNAVWVRGSDTDPWLLLHQYQIDTANMGVVYNSGSISLTDILSAAGQQFSTSTQVRFAQYDTSQIAATYYGNGLTFDNFKLYAVTNDVNLIACESIFENNCGLGTGTPVTVKIGNGVNNTLYQVAVSYQLDNLPVVTEYIDSIQGKDTILFTFNQTLDLVAGNNYNLSLWVYEPTDTYRLNDSINGMSIKNQPVISTFPYIENFENGMGHFYSSGRNSSWAYGTPASSKISHAASGQFAWKTNLNGSYNGGEFSYLYSPCFNIANMANPMLSFSIATDIEESNNTVYDLAYVEYTHDGKNWSRLGDTTSGTNWYNNSMANAWAKRNQTYWQVASIPLPTTTDIVSFRIVLSTDQGAEFEGVAIDDIHVYDLKYPIFDGDRFANAINGNNTAAEQQTDFVGESKIAGTVISGNTAIGALSLQSYGHQNFINPDSSQYFVPRSFAFHVNNVLADSAIVRVYVPDAAIKQIRFDETCPSCSKVWEVQDLGVTIYRDAERQKENNTLSDNQSGVYQYLPADKITWVPYDKGYYAFFSTRTLGEIWLNNGGPTQDKAVHERIFQFNAHHLGIKNALLNWSSALDEKIAYYELQRAQSDLNFSTIATFNAAGINNYQYEYVDTPSLDASFVHYRVMYFINQEENKSVIRTLDWQNKDPFIQVYPNPVHHGILNIEWFKGNEDAINWKLFNIAGQQLLDGNITEQLHDGIHTINLSNYKLAPGLYMLAIWSGKQKWSFKVVYLN